MQIEIFYDKVYNFSFISWGKKTGNVFLIMLYINLILEEFYMRFVCLREKLGTNTIQ